MYSFSYLEPVCCSISSSNCCFLTSLQISQEVGQVVWYSHLFQNFPQFIVIHTVKGFGIVTKAEIDVFSGTLSLFHWGLGLNRLTSMDMIQALTPFIVQYSPRGEKPNNVNHWIGVGIFTTRLFWIKISTLLFLLSNSDLATCCSKSQYWKGKCWWEQKDFQIQKSGNLGRRQTQLPEPTPKVQLSDERF